VKDDHQKLNKEAKTTQNHGTVRALNCFYQSSFAGGKLTRVTFKDYQRSIEFYQLSFILVLNSTFS
jgi:hypothetical protein